MYIGLGVIAYIAFCCCIGRFCALGSTPEDNDS